MNIIGKRLSRRERHRRNRQQDRDERAMRRAAKQGCYFCALSGKVEPATHGQLCKRHHDETAWPPAMDLPNF